MWPWCSSPNIFDASDKCIYWMETFRFLIIRWKTVQLLFSSYSLNSSSIWSNANLLSKSSEDKGQENLRTIWLNLSDFSTSHTGYDSLQFLQLFPVPWIHHAVLVHLFKLLFSLKMSYYLLRLVSKVPTTVKLVLTLQDTEKHSFFLFLLQS